MPDIQQHLSASQKVAYDDLDWDAARAAGLTEREVKNLQFFADIESQTVFYMLEVVKLEVARDPDLLTFLTMWNYEEYFHSHAISRLLRECGCEVPPPMSRATNLRSRARLRARLEDLVQMTLAKAMPRSFVALWMAWGAAQELLTCQAYEHLGRDTANPVLRELARRINKQERRHFAYYFTAARERLDGQPVAQRLVRTIFDRNWNPVGSGVKSPAEHAEMIARIFPGQELFAVMDHIDERMGTLPGLEGLDCCRRWASGVQPLLPVEARVPLAAAA
ncbi:MAG: hypothetical protein KBG48_23355 [Kofleriaceae bacterium]|nr:hypothetical protein [Kofleriaceae bacterium]MBP9170363.1 hypothetical protein [Kofleriaceae bacterium]MBP9860075.1 hypothetical protein [Kofleriaceae bacterium]